MADAAVYSSSWNRFWHQPVRAERLALTRILLGGALLVQQFVEYLPHLEEWFGAPGQAPAGLLDETQLSHWNWTLLFFNSDDPAVLYPLFWVWVACTLAFTVGFCSRLMNVAVWLLTMAWLARNFFLLDGGDDTLQIGLFLLMLSPSGQALSVDAWLRRRRTGDTEPACTPAWPVRVLQVQLCVIYCTSGLVKLQGTGWFEGTWWDGTSIHYVLNYLTMSRYSYASFPVPIWITAPMSWFTVWWEALFPILVLWRPTRKLALVYGILFHIGIWLTLAIGWFGFYMIALYGAWVPDKFWERYDADTPSIS